MKKAIYTTTIVLLILIFTTIFGYRGYQDQEDRKQSAVDSNKYFDVIFKIQNIEDLKKISLSSFQNIRSSSYKPLANLLLTNADFIKEPKNFDLESLNNHLNDKKSDKLLKDLGTISYAKILLYQVNLDDFKTHLLSELLSNSFSYRSAAREVVNLYYILNKEYEKVVNTNINFQEIPESAASRLQILVEEAKNLQNNQVN